MDDVLFLVDGLELNGLVRVLPTASRAATVEILFDMMPAKATNLEEAMIRRCVHLGYMRKDPTW